MPETCLNTMKQLLLFCSFLPFFCAARDSTGVKDFQRIYIGASLAPGVSYRLLTYKHFVPEPPLTESDFKEVFFYERQKEESPVFGFNSGIHIGVNIIKSVAFETGIEYSMLGYHRTKNNLTFASSFNPDGTIDSSLIYSLRYNSYYHYLSIPAGFSFRFGPKKAKALIRAGAYLNILLAHSQLSKLSSPGTGTSISHDSNFNIEANQVLNCSPYLSLGFAYEFNKLMQLEVAPTAQFQIRNIQRGYVEERLWSVGLSMIFQYGLLAAK